MSQVQKRKKKKRPSAKKPYILRMVQGEILCLGGITIDSMSLLMNSGVDMKNIKEADLPVVLPLIKSVVHDAVKSKISQHAPSVLSTTYAEWAEENLIDRYELLGHITDAHPLADSELEADEWLEFLEDEMHNHYQQNRPEKMVFLGDMDLKEVSKLFTDVLKLGTKETGNE